MVNEDEIAVWYSPELNAWWMDHIDPLVARGALLSIPDAIRVTNARDVLDKEFLASLTRNAGR